MFDHRKWERHIYRGSREEAEKLIDWLMAKHYWFDVETLSTDEQKPVVEITCGCEPSDLPFTFNNK